MSRALLMLSDERLGRQVGSLLQQPPLLFSVHRAESTSDALMITSGHAFALAIVELSLCRPLELEFIRHLVEASQTRSIFAVGEWRTDVAMPSDQAVRHVRLSDLVDEVTRWKVERS